MYHRQIPDQSKNTNMWVKLAVPNADLKMFKAVLLLAHTYFSSGLAKAYVQGNETPGRLVSVIIEVIVNYISIHKVMYHIYCIPTVLGPALITLTRRIIGRRSCCVCAVRRGRREKNTHKDPGRSLLTSSLS